LRAARLRAAVAALVLFCGVAHADDLHTVSLEMNDGKFVPTRLEVPAGVKFKIVVRNVGKTAAEFESLPLRKEKVLAPGAESFVVVHPLRPGEYGFFDDFHQEAQGVVVAK
jgi:uncharacterized cupredoxin-like copper-binding protein